MSYGKSYVNRRYFLSNLAANITIIAITATTINIPNPIPALKIPSIASQEVKENKRRNSETVISGLLFFMILNFKRITIYRNRYILRFRF